MGAWRTDANLFHQWEEAEARAEKWEKRAKEERAAHKKEVSEMMASFRAEMAEVRGELKGEIGRLEKRVGELEEENEALKEDNERLKSIINKNSNNSSKPPSSDEKPSIKKANEYNGREKSGKKRGGQPGHQGKSLTKKDAEELIRSGKAEHEIVEVNKPRKAGGKYISKYEYDIVTRTVDNSECGHNAEIPLFPFHHRFIIHRLSSRWYCRILAESCSHHHKHHQVIHNKDQIREAAADNHVQPLRQLSRQRFQ